MKAKLASLLALALAGCDDIPHARTDADIKKVAAEGAAPQMSVMQSKIDELERKMLDQQGEIDRLREFSLSINGAHESLRKTFNGNVDQHNQRLADQMTARGGCGQQHYYDDQGYPRLRNKPCKVSDVPK